MSYEIGRVDCCKILPVRTGIIQTFCWLSLALDEAELGCGALPEIHRTASRRSVACLGRGQSRCGPKTTRCNLRSHLAFGLYGCPRQGCRWSGGMVSPIWQLPGASPLPTPVRRLCRVSFLATLSGTGRRRIATDLLQYLVDIVAMNGVGLPAANLMVVAGFTSKCRFFFHFTDRFTKPVAHDAPPLPGRPDLPGATATSGSGTGEFC